MAYKFENRFSPSIVKLADSIECQIALAHTSLNDKAWAKLKSVRDSARDNADRIVKRGHGMMGDRQMRNDAFELIVQRQKERKELALSRRIAREVKQMQQAMSEMVPA